MSNLFKVGDIVRCRDDLYEGYPEANDFKKGQIHKILSVDEHYVRCNPLQPYNGYGHHKFELVQSADIKPVVKKSGGWGFDD